MLGLKPYCAECCISHFIYSQFQLGQPPESAWHTRWLGQAELPKYHPSQAYKRLC